MRSRIIVWSFLLIVCLAISTETLGCPGCKDGLAAADSEGANIARGYFYSILLMMAMPFTLAGSFGLYVWRETRRQQQANNGDSGGGSSAPAHPPAPKYAKPVGNPQDP